MALNLISDDELFGGATAAAVAKQRPSRLNLISDDELFGGVESALPEPTLGQRVKRGAENTVDFGRLAVATETGDKAKTAQIIAENQRGALPQTAAAKDMSAAIAPAKKAYDESSGLDAVGKFVGLASDIAGQLLRNPKEFVGMVAENAPNSVPGMAGGIAGAVAGSAAGPVGTAVGAVAGGTAGGYAIEQGAAFLDQVVKEAQKRGINPADQQAIAPLVAEKFDEFMSASRRKGVGTAGTDAILNTLTLGVAGAGERALAKTARGITEGVKDGSMTAAAGATKLAGVEAAQAARNTVGRKIARGAGITGAEMGGEGLSEAAGQKLAYDQVDATDVIYEGLLGAGQGAAMAAGRGAIEKVTGTSGEVDSAIQEARGITRPAAPQVAAAVQAGVQPGQPPADPQTSAPAGPSPAQVYANDAYAEIGGDEGVVSAGRAKRGVIALSLSQIRAIDGEEALVKAVEHLSAGDPDKAEQLFASASDANLISQGRASLDQDAIGFIQANEDIRQGAGLIEGGNTAVTAVPATNTPAQQTAPQTNSAGYIPEPIPQLIAQVTAVKQGRKDGAVIGLEEAQQLDVTGLKQGIAIGPDGKQALIVARSDELVQRTVARAREVGLEQAAGELLGVVDPTATSEDGPPRAIIQHVDNDTGLVIHEEAVEPSRVGEVRQTPGTTTRIRTLQEVLAERQATQPAQQPAPAPVTEEAPQPKFFARAPRARQPAVFSEIEQTGAASALIDSLNSTYKFSGDEALSKDSMREVKADRALTRMQSAIGTAFGVKVVFVKTDGLKRGNGKLFNTFNGIADSQNKTLFVNIDANAPLNVLGHELAHILQYEHPAIYDKLELVVLSRMRLKAAKQLQETLQKAMQSESGADSTAVANEFRKEVVAEGIGEMAEDQQLWADIFANIGEDGTMAKTFYQQVLDIIAKLQRALTNAGYIDGIRDVANVKKAITSAYKEWAKEYEFTGNNPANLTQDGIEMLHQFRSLSATDSFVEKAKERREAKAAEKAAEPPAPTVEKKPAKPKEQPPAPPPKPVAKAAPRDDQEANMEGEGGISFAREGEYKLDVERQDRAESMVAGLSAAEVSAIKKDAAELGLIKKQVSSLLDSARETRRRFPVRAGWARIEVSGLLAARNEDKSLKLGKDGLPVVTVSWKPISYGYNVPAGATKAPSKNDPVLMRNVADQFGRLVEGIYARAKEGDKNAQIIIGHQTWYRNVAEVLRREFGAQGDLFADLLGATSPNTPVDTNWRFSVDILRRFVRGEFDAEMQAFIKHMDAGGSASNFPGEKIRQASGKLYGMNSKNSMLAMADLWRRLEPGTAPKARNFALNLIGQSNMATIDVWAARMLRRAANMVRGMNLPRIPTVAEQGVTGNWNAQATAVTGEFGFGAGVLDLVSADLKAKGIDLSPPDLQALAWFAEKELWTRENWTSVQGEGGSFEENIEGSPMTRYLMGFSIQQGEKQPVESDVSTSQARLLSVLRGDDTVVSARVMPTYGMFMGKAEEAFDTEWTVKRGEHDPSLLMAEASRLAKEHPQMALFVSRVLRPNEDHPNARPGAEVYFKTGTKMADVERVMKAFVDRGQDGFTLAVDPRAKASARPGEEFIGVRIQYVPEFTGVSPEEVDAAMATARAQLQDAVAELRAADVAVAFAQVYNYDTVVVSKDGYDEFIDRAAAGRHQETGSQVWGGQSVRQRLEGAASRIQSDAEPVGGTGVQAASDPAAEAGLTQSGEKVLFSRRYGPDPVKTQKAYKLFVKKNDQLFPLFVNAKQPVPLGEWLDADVGELKDGKVKSNIGPLAFRPGWHAGDLPVATHIGSKSSADLKAPDTRPDNHVWAEVEMAADRDWQSVANERARRNAAGDIIPNTAHITDQVPVDGFYRYKTNANMTGNWLIGGSMKVNRILDDAEVKSINDAAGVSDLPRASVRANTTAVDRNDTPQGRMRNERLIELRKQESVLRSIMGCL